MLIYLSFALRFIQGIGAGISGVIIYSLTVNYSKKHEINKNVGYIEIGYAIGYAIGPIFGTFMKSYFGYQFPFYILGLVKLFAIASVSQFKITNVESDDTNFFHILFQWKILLTFIAVIIGLNSVIFYEPVLGNHLYEIYKISNRVYSIFLDIQVVANFLSVNLSNKIISKLGCKLSISLGLFMTFIGVNLLGPINYLPKSVYFTILGLILLGPCEVIISLSSVEDYINTIVYDLKYKRDEANDIASSVYSLSTSLGDAVGPIIGGFFTERNGFVDACKYVSLQNLFWFGVFTFFSLKEIKYQLFEKKMKKKDDKGVELIEVVEDDKLENGNEEDEEGNENEEYEDGNENEEYEEGNEDDEEGNENENEEEENENDKIKAEKIEDDEEEKVDENNENNDLSNKDKKINENYEKKMTMDETRRYTFDDDKNNNGDKENNNIDGDEIVLDVIENNTK